MGEGLGGQIHRVRRAGLAERRGQVSGLDSKETGVTGAWRGTPGPRGKGSQQVTGHSLQDWTLAGSHVIERGAQGL